MGRTSARIVVIGGGWGGLSAARQLRMLAPDVDVVLIERNAAFWSHPLSNRWLVGRTEHALRYDYHTAANRYGYHFVQEEVISIDRTLRQVRTRSQALNYDYLILSPGIRENFSDWFGSGDGDSDRAAQFTREHFPSAFDSTGGSSTHRLKTKLEAMRQKGKAGDWVMTIPAMPYRCPPAPYERAGMIAWWMKEHRIKGRLIVLDANQPPPAFSRVFREAYSDQLVYLPQSQIKSLDPYQRRVTTDFDTIDFDDAILMPGQQAADILGKSGLSGTDGWSEQDPIFLHSRGDERVFVIGDSLGRVSPLFGYYPKTGEIAAQLGMKVAHQIVSQIYNQAAPKTLPASTCFVVQRIDPIEMTRIDTSYRFRPDGVIQQFQKSTHFPLPQDEDVQWAKTALIQLGF